MTGLTATTARGVLGPLTFRPECGTDVGDRPGGAPDGHGFAALLAGMVGGTFPLDVPDAPGVPAEAEAPEHTVDTGAAGTADPAAALQSAGQLVVAQPAPVPQVPAVPAGPLAARVGGQGGPQALGTVGGSQTVGTVGGPQTPAVPVADAARPDAAAADPAQRAPAPLGPLPPTSAPTATTPHPGQPDQEADDRGAKSRAPAATAAPAAVGPVPAEAVAASGAGRTEAPSRAALPVSQQLYGVLERVARASPGQHRLTLRLDPGSLGEVHIHLTSRDGVLHVRLAAGHEAQAEIQRGSGDLQRLLAGAGAHDVRVTVRELDAAAASPDGRLGGSGPGWSDDTPRDQSGRGQLTTGTDLSGSGSDGSRDPARKPGPNTATEGARDPAQSEPGPLYPGGAALSGVDLAL